MSRANGGIHARVFCRGWLVKARACTPVVRAVRPASKHIVCVRCCCDDPEAADETVCRLVSAIHILDTHMTYECRSLDPHIRYQMLIRCLVRDAQPKIQTLSGGSLGSWVEEGRGKMRCLRAPATLLALFLRQVERTLRRLVPPLLTAFV